jgi:hypothetical protein
LEAGLSGTPVPLTGAANKIMAVHCIAVHFPSRELPKRKRWPTDGVRRNPYSASNPEGVRDARNSPDL